jgi:hypothetical protein
MIEKPWPPKREVQVRSGIKHDDSTLLGCRFVFIHSSCSDR